LAHRAWMVLRVLQDLRELLDTRVQLVLLVFQDGGGPLGLRVTRVEEEILALQV